MNQYPADLETQEIPASSLSLTTWGDVALFRGNGLYSRDCEGVWTLCTDPRDGALWIGARDLMNEQGGT